MEFTLERDLNTIDPYFASLKLKLNVKKTKVMCFDRKLKHSDCNFTDVYLSNIIVEKVKTFLYLGITIEESLNFKEQINTNLKKGNHKVYLMRKIRGSLDTQTALLLLFKATVLPYVEYANCL